MCLKTLHVSDAILAHDPFVLRTLGLSAKLAGIQFGRNILNDGLANGLQQALQPVSVLLVHGVSFTFVFCASCA
jgi:hypothetical protein